MKLIFCCAKVQSLTMQWTRPKGRAAPEVAEWRHCEFDTVHIFPASQTDVVIASATATSSIGLSGRADGGLPSATTDNLLAQSFNPKASGAMAFDDGRILMVHAELVEDDVGVATPVWITISDMEGDSLGESRVDAVAFPLELASPASRLATECVCFSVHIPLVLLAQCIMVAGILFLHEHCS